MTIDPKRGGAQPTAAAERLDIIAPLAGTAMGQNNPVTVRLILLLSGLAAGGTFATNILLPSLPNIAKSFGVTTLETGPALSSFFATFAVGQLLAGPLSDRYGRRKIILPGLAIFIAGSLLCACADSMPWLVAGRIVQALGACGAAVLARAIARDLFAGTELRQALSYMMIATACAPGFSPLLGSIVDQYFGWQACFLAVAIFGSLVAVAYATMLGETGLMSAATLNIGSIGREYLRLARDPRFLSPASISALIFSGLFAMFAASPAIIMDMFKLSSMTVGFFFATTVFAVFGSGIVAPRLASRIGAYAAIRWGIVIALIGGIILFALARIGINSLPAYLGAAMVFLLGMGTVSPLATALTLSPFADRAGSASSLVGFMQMAGATISVALTTATVIDPMTALGALLIIASAASGLILLRSPHLRDRASAA